MKRIFIAIGVVASIALAACAEKAERPRDVSAPTIYRPGPAPMPSAPSAVQPAKPKPLSTKLVKVSGSDRYCPENVVESKPITEWKRAGGHPYKGDLAYALAQFREVPLSVRRAWAEKVKAGQFDMGEIADGDIACSMMWTTDDAKHRRSDMTRAKAGDDNSPVNTKTKKYSASTGGFKYTLVEPTVCDNWNWYAERDPIPVPNIPQTAPKKTAYFLGVLPVERRTLSKKTQELARKVREWESNGTYPYDLGSISRDLDKYILAELKSGSARTISQKCVRATVTHPGSPSGGRQVEGCKGQERGSQHTYWREWFDRDTIGPDSQFGAALLPHDYPGCEIFYPRPAPSHMPFVGTPYFDTRPPNGKPGNTSELYQHAHVSGAEGGWLIALLDCAA